MVEAWVSLALAVAVPILRIAAAAAAVASADSQRNCSCVADVPPVTLPYSYATVVGVVAATSSDTATPGRHTSAAVGGEGRGGTYFASAAAAAADRCPGENDSVATMMMMMMVVGPTIHRTEVYRTVQWCTGDRDDSFPPPSVRMGVVVILDRVLHPHCGSWTS